MRQTSIPYASDITLFAVYEPVQRLPVSLLNVVTVLINDTFVRFTFIRLRF